jgi:phosphoribosylanthranilate isomerase
MRQEKNIANLLSFLSTNPKTGMPSPGTPFVKICCISSEAEARMAVAHGVSAIGLVSAMPSGPGVIGDDLIARIARSVPPTTATFLLTALQVASDIARQHAQCRTTAIQLVDALPDQQLRELRALLPGIQLVQVIHVTGEESVAQSRAVAPLVDTILLDSGNPALRIKELGGTGRTHDWNLSRRICRESAVPVVLAGGLNPSNVAAALQDVAPFGVDICSGVRTDGHLDAGKLHRFLAAARVQPLTS